MLPPRRGRRGLVFARMVAMGFIASFNQADAAVWGLPMPDDGGAFRCKKA